MKLLIIFTAIFFSLAHAEAKQVKISAAGGWNFTVDASDLTPGPGGDMADKESAPSATFLTVSVKGPGWKVEVWRVDARRSDTVWDGNLILYVRRTSDGTGSGTVSGGSSYIPVGLTNTPFFSGSESKSNMGVQYRLGSSVSVPPGSYGTTVIYTITQQ
jgi:hypothetical protein